MSQWIRFFNEAGVEVNSIYGNELPLEVRYYLADWLEEKFM